MNSLAYSIRISTYNTHSTLPHFRFKTRFHDIDCSRHRRSAAYFTGGLSSPSYASVPRSQRFNPIAVSANGPATPAMRRRKASRSNDESDDEGDEEFEPRGSIDANDKLSLAP